MPIFTRHLSPSGYGVLSLVGTVQSLLEPLFSMGMQGAATRLYYDTPDASLRKRLFGTLLRVLLPPRRPAGRAGVRRGPKAHRVRVLRRSDDDAA